MVCYVSTIPESEITVDEAIKFWKHSTFSGVAAIKSIRDLSPEGADKVLRTLLAMDDVKNNKQHEHLIEMTEYLLGKMDIKTRRLSMTFYQQRAVDLVQTKQVPIQLLDRIMDVMPDKTSPVSYVHWNWLLTECTQQWVFDHVATRAVAEGVNVQELFNRFVNHSGGNDCVPYVLTKNIRDPAAFLLEAARNGETRPLYQGLRLLHPGSKMLSKALTVAAVQDNKLGCRFIMDHGVSRSDLWSFPSPRDWQVFAMCTRPVVPNKNAIVPALPDE